jgi:hypothetical protein
MPRHRHFVALAALAVLCGCAAKRLPPGTPPPEYETRELAPWTAEALDAGAAAPSPVEPAPAPVDTTPPFPSDQPKTDGAPLDAGLGPSPDAGVR